MTDDLSGRGRIRDENFLRHPRSVYRSGVGYPVKCQGNEMKEPRVVALPHGGDQWSLSCGWDSRVAG
jgi:hypothetical protein